jgi:hypothetical protein
MVGRPPSPAFPVRPAEASIVPIDAAPLVSAAASATPASPPPLEPLKEELLHALHTVVVSTPSDSPTRTRLRFRKSRRASERSVVPIT